MFHGMSWFWTESPGHLTVAMQNNLLIPAMHKKVEQACKVQQAYVKLTECECKIHIFSGHQNRFVSLGVFLLPVCQLR